MNSHCLPTFFLLDLHRGRSVKDLFPPWEIISSRYSGQGPYILMPLDPSDDPIGKVGFTLLEWCGTDQHKLKVAFFLIIHKLHMFVKIQIQDHVTGRTIFDMWTICKAKNNGAQWAIDQQGCEKKAEKTKYRYENVQKIWCKGEYGASRTTTRLQRLCLLQTKLLTVKPDIHCTIFYPFWADSPVVRDFFIWTKFQHHGTSCVL